MNNTLTLRQRIAYIMGRVRYNAINWEAVSRAEFLADEATEQRTIERYRYTSGLVGVDGRVYYAHNGKLVRYTSKQPLDFLFFERSSKKPFRGSDAETITLIVGMMTLVLLLVYVVNLPSAYAQYMEHRFDTPMVGK